MLSASLIYEIYLDGFSRIFWSTQTHLVLSVVTLLLMISLRFLPKSKSGKLENWTLLLFAVAWVVQIPIMLIYWIRLYPLHIVHPKWIPTRLYWWHNVNKHGTPFFAFTYIFFTSRRISFKITRPVKIFFFFYATFLAVMNATGQYVRGEPLYPIACWIETPGKMLSIIYGTTFVNTLLFQYIGRFTMIMHGLERKDSSIKND